MYTLTHCRVVIVWVTSLSLNRGQLYFIDPRKYRVHCKDVCCICSRPAPCRGKVSVMCCVLKQRSIICHLCYLILSSLLSAVFTEIVKSDFSFFLYPLQPLGFKVDDTKLKRAGLDYWPYPFVGCKLSVIYMILYELQVLYLGSAEY